MAVKKLFVLSVYCPDIEIYPYHPFIATSMYDGIKQYLNFINKKVKVCPNPELHLIGHCLEVNGMIRDIQPLLAPQLVDLSPNKLQWTLVTLINLSLKLVDYLDNIRNSLWKKKLKK